MGSLRAQALEGPTPLPQNPWAIEGAEGFFRLLDACISVLLPTVVLLCLASLVVQFRRSTGVQRQQLKWFTYAAPLAVGSWTLLTATGAGRAAIGPGVGVVHHDQLLDDPGGDRDRDLALPAL